MIASELAMAGGPLVLYTGSNRSAKRDQALSVRELNRVCRDAHSVPDVFKLSRQYFQNYVRQVESFSHVSSFSSLANLARDEGWVFSPHYLAFEEIKPYFT